MTIADTWKIIVERRSRNPLHFLARALLRTISIGYGAIAWLRNRLYDAEILKTHRAGATVVSVGNLTMGGTGKTPCVEWVADFFRKRDCRVAILSRGYGADSGPNDEALLLEENLPDVPNLQGRDRVALAKIAVEELESEVLVLDDGFQHRRLERDANIVLFDATQKAIHLFPRGWLRDPLSELRRADSVILSHADRVSASDLEILKTRLRAAKQNLPIALARHQPLGWLRFNDAPLLTDAFSGQKAIAFCGLGKPESFRRTLEEMGIQIVDFQAFADHHDYSAEDVQSLTLWATQFPAGTPILTSQKDFVKLQIAGLGDYKLWYLRIGLNIFEGQEKIEQLLGRFAVDEEM